MITTDRPTATRTTERIPITKQTDDSRRIAERIEALEVETANHPVAAFNSSI